MPTGTVETLRQKKAALHKKKAALEARIAAIEQTEKSSQRKEDTRHKVLVGAGILADVAKHPETRGAVETALRRAITADRDRAFLKSQGWAL